MKQLLIISFTLISFSAWTQSIFIDESFDDWTDKMLILDEEGDNPSSLVGFEDLQIHNDDGFLFIKLKLNQEILLQDNNSISVYIDADNNANTGYQINGIGSEISFNFGQRTGYLNLGSQTYYLTHDQMGLVSLPTVTSDEFEMMFSRKCGFGTNTITMANTIKIVVDDGRTNGDQIPNALGGVSYQMIDNKPIDTKSFMFDKSNPDFLRVMSYNVRRDDLFNLGTSTAQMRLIEAINPDIIAFQEIYDNNSNAVAFLLDNILPLGQNRKWQTSKVNPDIILASKFPIVGSQRIDGNGMFLVDLGEKSMVVFNAHLPCCDNNTQRQQEVDNIIYHVRRMKEGSGLNFNVPNGSPFIITGDMNFVGDKQQVTSFIEGNIINESIYGIDVNPDWDGSHIEDAVPSVTGLPVSYTWYSAGNSYIPGRLDYLFYSGSVMTLENSYVLNTQTLNKDLLLNHYLDVNDSSVGSDHLPIVCDFDLGLISNVFDDKIQEVSISPNPAKDVININSNMVSGTLTMYDALGRIVLFSDINNNFTQDISMLKSGIYVLHLKDRDSKGVIISRLVVGK